MLQADEGPLESAGPPARRVQLTFSRLTGEAGGWRDRPEAGERQQSVSFSSHSGSANSLEQSMGGGGGGGGGRLRPTDNYAPGQRHLAPRLSLLGKPICLSSAKCHYRDTRSMRWKKRLRNFLEQPQGPLPWLYHSAL